MYYELLFSPFPLFLFFVYFFVFQAVRKVSNGVAAVKIMRKLCANNSESSTSRQNSLTSTSTTTANTTGTNTGAGTGTNSGTSTPMDNLIKSTKNKLNIDTMVTPSGEGSSHVVDSLAPENVPQGSQPLPARFFSVDQGTPQISPNR